MKIFVLLFVLFLSGCGTPGPLISNLQKPSEVRAFTLNKKYEADFQKLKPKVSEAWRFGFFAGDYVAENENALGTFYRGPRHSVFLPSGGGRYVVRTGGVWIPKNDKDKVLLFTYFNFEWFEVANLDAALAKDPHGTTTIGINVTVSPYSNAGVVGGAAGSAIVNLLIASDNGKYQLEGYIDDPQFADEIRKALKTK